MGCITSCLRAVRRRRGFQVKYRQHDDEDEQIEFQSLVSVQTAQGINRASAELTSPAKQPQRDMKDTSFDNVSREPPQSNVSSKPSSGRTYSTPQEPLSPRTPAYAAPSSAFTDIGTPKPVITPARAPPPGLRDDDDDFDDDLQLEEQAFLAQKQAATKKAPAKPIQPASDDSPLLAFESGARPQTIQLIDDDDDFDAFLDSLQT
eukprot:m.469851 g.469851  ORF g.469851 m.469851 type:complete len:205 (+) comp57090_c0_seq28:80-694(+)